MLKKVIKYTDFDGNKREEEAFFHLTQAEILEMEMGIKGGMSEHIKQIVAAQDAPALMELFKSLICKSYGIKSADGRTFKKSKEALEDFMSTEAYSQLFMELATNDEEGAKFVNGIMPSDIQKEMQKEDFKATVEKATKK